MRFNRNLLLVFLPIFLWLSGAVAQSASDSIGAEGHFRAGVEAFQKNQLAEARTAFQQSLKEDELNPVTLFNLAMVEQRSGKNGLSLALWRKALAIDPSYQPARRAETWAHESLKRRELPRESLLWESFRNQALKPVSLGKYLLMTALGLFASGWLVLKYLGERRRARLEERSRPAIPILAIIFSVVFVSAALMSAAKAYDMSVLRGTIILEKVEARTSPSDTGTPLFELYEGIEVIIRKSVDGWRQVTYPGGSTGWIPQPSVFATSDKVAP